MHPFSGSLQEEVFRKLYGTGFVTAKNPSAPSRQVSAAHELFAHLLLSPGVTCTVSHQVIESVEMLQLQKKQKQEEQVRKEEAKKTMTSATAKSHSSNSSFLSVGSGSESDFQLLCSRKYSWYNFRRFLRRLQTRRSRRARRTASAASLPSSCPPRPIPSTK